VVARDDLIAEQGIVFPDHWTHLPVAAFEIESGSGKHAGGALLNLNAYGVLGLKQAKIPRPRDSMAPLGRYRLSPFCPARDSPRMQFVRDNQHLSFCGVALGAAADRSIRTPTSTIPFVNSAAQ
jgi:hypothetical protein